MPEAPFAFNAEMKMPDGTPFPVHATFPDGTLFFVKDVSGTWHEAKTVDHKMNNGVWYKLTGKTKHFPPA